MSLKIGLLGYGKMGREIENLAEARGHKIAAKFDIDTPLAADSRVANIDVFIDFTAPDAVLGNVELLAKLGKPAVIGTTGWNQHLTTVKQLADSAGTGIIYASNFSIGMNLFFRVVSAAAEMFDAFENYDVSIHEIHHRAKLDSPSGTALSLAQIVLDKMSRKRDLLTSSAEGKISPEQLHVSSTRVGSTPGTHLVAFDGEADTIELKHTARNRAGFAEGALTAAEWIVGKRGLFSIDDLLQDFLKS